MCGGYGGDFEPPHDDPWYFKILDAIVWVIWAVYQIWKGMRRIGILIGVVCLFPVMLVTWPWWGYRYYKDNIN